MNLESWRSEIDEIDLEIAGLLQKRIRIAGEIGKLKMKAGLPLVDYGREEFIMQRVLHKCRGEFRTVEAVTSVFDCILEESRRVQEPFCLGLKSDFGEEGETKIL